VIEPVFEANFQDNSYGSVPNGCTASGEVVREALEEAGYVVDADIQSYLTPSIMKC